MPCLAVLLWAVSASAGRLVVTRPAVRSAPLPVIVAAAPALSPLSASIMPAMPATVSLSATVLAAPADATAAAPIPDSDGFMGKTAQALATLPPDHRDWDEQVFEELFSGRYKGPKPWSELPDSSKVVVGETVVDKRAPGARELLKTLVLPDERPVLGLFLRDGELVLNGVAMGPGAWGHRDVAPPDADVKTHGGYSLRLTVEGALRLVASGTYPADMTPRLLRALSRYYGLSPRDETAWGRLKRRLHHAWDVLSVLAKS